MTLARIHHTQEALAATLMPFSLISYIPSTLTNNTKLQFVISHQGYNTLILLPSLSGHATFLKNMQVAVAHAIKGRGYSGSISESNTIGALFAVWIAFVLCLELTIWEWHR